MRERNKKRKQHQADLPEQVGSNSRTDDTDKETEAPLETIKSTCLWEIPGDVPGGRRRMPLPQAPSLSVTTLRRPAEQEKTDTVTREASEPQTEDQTEARAQTTPPLQLAKQVAKQVTFSLVNSNSHNTNASIEKQSLSNESETENPLDKTSKTLPPGKIAESRWQQPVPSIHDIDKIEKPVTPVGELCESSDRQSFLTPPENSNPASLSTYTDIQDKKKYRSFLPALLLLLLMASIGGAVFDYLSGRNQEDNVTALDTGQTQIIPVIEENTAPVEQTSNETLQTSSLVDDTADALPVVEISTSTLEQQPVIVVHTIAHVVVKGDTLWDISQSYLNDPFRYPELAELSNIKNPDLIYPGDIVYIQVKTRNIESTTDSLPLAEANTSGIEHQSINGMLMLSHVVIKGDTLWDISQSYLNNPFRYPELAKLSNIKNPDLIYPGDIVHIRVKTEN